MVVLCANVWEDGSLSCPMYIMRKAITSRSDKPKKQGWRTILQKKNQSNIKPKPKKYPGYTPQSGEVAAKRNCVAAGGKWVNGAFKG